MEQDSSTQSPVLTLTPAPRLWRPAAQRNLRNQWANLASLTQKWPSSSSTARSHATSLVNAYLSQRYMKDMELGVLSDMPNIKKKACWKLFKQQEIHRSKLLSSYKDMVAIVVNMVNYSSSMRCYLKGSSSSPLVQFCSSSENRNDYGDGGGIPVFMFLSIPSFEKLAQEVVEMFTMELILKRLLVMEFLSVSSEEGPKTAFCWSDELYPGEFNDLCNCNLYSKEACEPVHPRIDGCKSDTLAAQSNHQPDSDTLQLGVLRGKEMGYLLKICFAPSYISSPGHSSVICTWKPNGVYLTTWLVDVNIDKHRVEEILSIVGEEIHISLP